MIKDIKSVIRNNHQAWLSLPSEGSSTITFPVLYKYSGGFLRVPISVLNADRLESVSDGITVSLQLRGSERAISIEATMEVENNDLTSNWEEFSPLITSFFPQYRSFIGASSNTVLEKFIVIRLRPHKISWYEGERIEELRLELV